MKEYVSLKQPEKLTEDYVILSGIAIEAEHIKNTNDPNYDLFRTVAKICDEQFQELNKKLDEITKYLKQEQIAKAWGNPPDYATKCSQVTLDPKELSIKDILPHFQIDTVRSTKNVATNPVTGAMRSTDADKERYDLISPTLMRRLAETCAEGAKKYGPYNWEKGFPVSDLLNHALRHLYLYLSGDRQEDHLAHALWNVGAACHSEEKWPELNKELFTARPAKKPEPSDCDK